MHKPSSHSEKETHKILWEFEMQIDRTISARRLEHMLISKIKKEFVI